MRIEWRDSMSVGDFVLDFQHRHLLYLLNGFRMALEEGNLEAAQFSILEYQDLSDMHMVAEVAFISENDLYYKSKHAAAHATAARHIETMRTMVCEQADPAEILRKFNECLFDVIIDLFSFDRNVKQNLMETERRKIPRLSAGGFVAEIGGNLLDVIDITPEGITLKSESEITEQYMSFALMPRVRTTVLSSEQIVISGTAAPLTETSVSIHLTPESKHLLSALTRRLFPKMQMLFQNP